MKRLAIVLLLLLTFGQLRSQLYVEHLYETTKTYNPWFGNDKGSLSVSLELSYREGGDSMMALIFDISQTKATAVAGSTSIGASVAGAGNSWGLVGALAGSFASSKSYTLSNTQGVAVFDQKSYDSLLIVIKRLRKIAGDFALYGKTVFFKINKVVLGLDIHIKKESDGTKKPIKSYYFQIDNSTFRLSENEFTDLCDNSLELLKESFRQFHDAKAIVLPVSN